MPTIFPKQVTMKTITRPYQQPSESKKSKNHFGKKIEYAAAARKTESGQYAPLAPEESTMRSSHMSSFKK